MTGWFLVVLVLGFAPSWPPDEIMPVSLKNRKGGDMGEWPERLRVRQWPTVGTSA